MPPLLWLLWNVCMCIFIDCTLSIYTFTRIYITTLIIATQEYKHVIRANRNKKHEVEGCEKRPTVQIFNSCTSRPDVCHCLVVQTSMNNMSRKKPNTSMKHAACEPKLGSVVTSYIRPCQEKLGGNQACGRVFCPGCPHI